MLRQCLGAPMYIHNVKTHPGKGSCSATLSVFCAGASRISQICRCLTAWPVRCQCALHCVPFMQFKELPSCVTAWLLRLYKACRGQVPHGCTALGQVVQRCHCLQVQSHALCCWLLNLGMLCTAILPRSAPA